MSTIASLLNLSEYLNQEEKSETKHEYFNGKVVEMPGETSYHNLIAARMITALTNAVDKKKQTYYVLSSDMKIYIPAFNAVVYPDAVVICEEMKYYEERNDVIINPLLVVEVLSPSTEAYDRSSKFLKYRTLPSFREYVVVRQDKPQITTFYREKPGIWHEGEAEGIDQEVYLASIDHNITLKKIYKGVTFD